MAAQQYSDQEIIAALIAVGEVSGAAYSVAKYNQLRAKTQPSSALIIQRFGSWNQALKAAGLTQNSASRKYSKKYDEVQVSEWVKRYLSVTENPNYQDFSHWLRTQPTAPSAQTCRNIVGSWKQILELANT